MAALTGNKIKDSYLGLLKSIGNGAISSSFVQISDGGGNALPLYLSTSSIKFYNAYTFPSADGTVSGQVLSTDANGTLSWVTSSDNQTLEEVLTQGNTTTIAISSSANITTTAQFNGDINGALLQKVKAAEVLSKGDVVYISGGTGDNPEVSKANASDSTKMPALGIMKESLNNINDEGECITSGELTGVNLTGFSTGDELFVSSTTAGELVTTAPTGEANLIQKIGKVIKGGNGGALTVLGAFRTNAVPNLNSAKIFLGNASNEAVSTAISGDATISDTGVIALATVPVTKGGTGATTLTGILLGNATSAISGITSAVDGHVLTADGNGGYDFEVASGDVSISGTPTTNQVAIWTDGSTIKGMSALEIDVNDKITLDQDASSYNIGGGNIANVTGNYNTGFGLDNLLSVTTGTRNVAFGYNSLKDLTIGTDNVAIGYLALQDVTEAIKCVAVGTEALSSVTTGHFNVAVGHTAGAYVSTSTRNTLVGYGSGSQLDTTGTPSGGYNTFIGYQAGSNVTTGSKNVVIGSNTNFVDGLNNYIVLSDGDGNLRMYLDNNGQLNLFSEISLRDSSATNNPLMFQIQGASYTASSPYNTNKLIASNNSNISFQTGSTDALFIQGTTGDATFSGNVEIDTNGGDGALGGTLKLSSTNTNVSARNWALINTWDNYGDLTFRVGNAQGDNPLTSGSTKMVIKPGGNVGIGINPSTKFQVNDGEDINLAIKVGQTNTSAVMLNAYNDGATANIAMEFRASSFAFQNGNVGIGNTNPSDYHSPADNLVIGTSGDNGLTIVSGTSNGGTICFADGTTGGAQYSGFIDYQHSTNAMRFGTNGGLTALTISSGGVSTFSGDVNVINSYANDPLIKLATNTSGNAEVQVRTATTSYNPGIGVVTSGYDFNIFTANTPRLTISSGGITSLLTNQAKTSTSNVEYALLGRTNESTNYSALQLLQKGNASNSLRSWSFQTIEAGVANAGNIIFQPSGGLVQVGDGSSQNTFLTTKSLAGWYSGIKLTRGLGDGSSISDNNFGMLVTDNGWEVATFTSPSNNITGRSVKLTITSGGDVTASNKKNSSNFTDKTTTPYAEEKIYKLFVASGTTTADICTITSAYTNGSFMVECNITGQWAGNDTRTGSYKKALISLASGSLNEVSIDQVNGAFTGTINYTYVTNGVLKINLTSMNNIGSFNGIAYVRVIGGNNSNASNVTPLGFTLS